MSAEVVDMESRLPHFAVYDPVSNQAHVMPVSIVTKMIDGNLPISEWDESATRALLRLLLETVAND